MPDLLKLKSCCDICYNSSQKFWAVHIFAVKWSLSSPPPPQTTICQFCFVLFFGGKLGKSNNGYFVSVTRTFASLIDNNLSDKFTPEMGKTKIR